eukprot:234886_1
MVTMPQAVPCETLHWLKARHLTSQTDSTLLMEHTNDILQCFGGIQQCLAILLENRNHMTTSQAANLSNLLTEINRKNKPNQSQEQDHEPNVDYAIMTVEDKPRKKENKDKNNEENERNQPSTCNNLKAIGSQCLEYITNFLPLQDLNPFSNVCVSFAIIGIEQCRKTDYFFIDGHELIIKDAIANQLAQGRYIDKRELPWSVFRQHRIFKDETFQTLFANLSAGISIPLQHLIVLHYTKRKNCTFRPNRRVMIRWDQQVQDRFAVTEEMILTHTVPTRPAKKYINSTHRVGSLQLTRRKFMLLDARKLRSVPHELELCDQTRLIALKYFDVFTQTLHFVDWIWLSTKSDNQIQNVVYYIETDLIHTEKYYFVQCKDYLQQIEAYESEGGTTQDHLILYEEGKEDVELERYLDRIGYDNDTNELLCGDILVFQINTTHSFFSSHPLPVQTELMGWKHTLHRFADSFMKSIPPT